MYPGPASIRLRTRPAVFTPCIIPTTRLEANVTGLATVKSGFETWFFLTADYAFGQTWKRTPPMWW